jgi:hypothetical protein
MMGHHPPYYARLIEQAGFHQCKDLLAIWFPDANTLPERGVDAVATVLARAGATVRPLDLKRFDEDVQAIREIYNSAWSKNWGFVPITDEEFEWVARDFKPIVDPDLCLIAEVGGEAIGFSLALPNMNEAIRHLRGGRLLPFGFLKLLWYKRRIEAVRLITFGFKPRFHHSGLGLGFYFQTWKTAGEKGYTCGEASWILEDNFKMVRPLERMGGQAYRRYRIFERPLSSPASSRT